MAWSAYFVLNGSEIINAERVETYLEAERVSWFRPYYKTTAISTLTGETYINSWVDEPPWGDPDNPDTYRFWGVYPLNITGISDSTRTAEITENIGAGGTIGDIRDASRAMVFEVALLGQSECAVEAGFNWLKAACSENACSDNGCGGGELCYFSCEPCVTDDCIGEEGALDACIAEHSRTLRGVKVVGGPVVTAERTLSDGSVMWTATFTVVAGNPYEFGSEVDLVEGFGVASDPWVPEIIPADWQFSDEPEEIEDVDCALAVYEPIVDPLCPAIEVPPAPPSIPIGCFELPDAWERRWFTIPRKYVPYWGNAVPVVRIQASDTEVRGLRLRFYADLNADASTLDDPCSYCGDIVFSYIPVNHTMVFDGVSQTIYAEGPGGTIRRADSLVFKSDGTPFDWPVLSCGLGYVVAVDVPVDTELTMPAVDLSMVPRGS